MPRRAREEDGFNPESKGDVEANRPEGAAAKMDGFGNHHQVIAHEGDIRGFNGGVGAGCTHGDADISGSKRGGIVHTVADHAGPAEFSSQFFNLLNFVVGQKIAFGFINSRLFGYGAHGTGIISAEHDNFANAGLIDAVNSFGRIRTDRIADGENAEHFALTVGVRAMPDDHDRLRLGFNFREQGFQFFGADAELVRKSMVSDK